MCRAERSQADECAVLYQRGHCNANSGQYLHRHPHRNLWGITNLMCNFAHSSLAQALVCMFTGAMGKVLRSSASGTPPRRPTPVLGSGTPNP